MNSDSILNSIKKMLGVSPEFDDFDTDIIIHINTVFSILDQLGVVGPGDTGYSISDYTSTWNEYLGDKDNLNLIKTYVYLRVRLLFDPPTSTQIKNALNEQISEMGYRIFTIYNTPEYTASSTKTKEVSEDG